MKRYAALLLGVSAIVMSVGAWAVPEGAPGLVEAILSRHPWMVAPAAREDLDRAHRLFRQADAAENPRRGQPRAALPEGKTADDLRAEAWGLAEGALGQARPLVDVDLTGALPALDPAGPAVLPGSEGAVLYRVRRGAEGAACAVVEHTMIMREMAQPLVIPTAPAGVTWALVRISEAATDETHHVFAFGGEGAPAVSVPVSWRAPKPARLSLAVLSDDSGEPAPAMVQLRWETDGQVYAPSNALDLATRFEGQGNATSRRFALLAGELRGDYYCVPGPFDMMVPPGTWQVTVRRGLEHLPASATVTLEEGGATSLTLRPERWVNMPGQGWYSGDDHVHFRMMSDLDADILMAWVQAEDIHVANVVRMGDISRTYFEQRGWGPDFRVTRGIHTLSPGQECPRTHDEMGHTLSMNTTGMVRDTERYYLYDEHFDKVHAQGGLAGYAHVNANLFHVDRDMTLNIPREKVDFVEIFQFGGLGLTWYYDFLNLGFEVTACCGSDVPWAGTVGEARTYAYTGDAPFTPDAWFDALRAGGTFVTNGPMVEFAVDGHLPGERVRVTGDGPVEVKARAFGHERRARPVKLEIVVLGEAVHTVTAGEDGAAALETVLSLDPEHGCWVAARAEGADGSMAHTTPVYLEREGLRFWKYDALDELLGKRRASLNEIRQVVADAKARDARGEVETNRAVKQLALQGDELLKRVVMAEAFYDRLEQQAREEAQARGATAGQ